MFKLALAFVACLGSLVLGFAVGMRYEAVASETRQSCMSCDMSQLRLALHNYHATHGHFPPTIYRATPESPPHSWRVLLLPYFDFDQKEVFERYDLAQAWDSPHNQKVLQSIETKTIYSLRRFPASTATAFLAADVKEGWDRKTPLRTVVVEKDGDTFILVEDLKSSIPWMKPED